MLWENLADGQRSAWLFCLACLWPLSDAASKGSQINRLDNPAKKGLLSSRPILWGNNHQAAPEP